MKKSILILLLLTPFLSFPQDKLKAFIAFTDTSVLKVRSSFKDQAALDKYLEELISELHRKGRLEASIDSFRIDSLHHDYFLHTGPEYKWAKLRKGNAEVHYLQKAGFKAYMYDQKTFDAESFSSFRKKLIRAYENDGYPFASVQIDSLVNNGTTLSATLNVRKNKLFIIDSIRIRGNSKISETYLFNYIGIKPGDIYNESVISRIDMRLKEISFINVTRPTEVIFTPKYTKVLICANTLNVFPRFRKYCREIYRLTSR